MTVSEENVRAALSVYTFFESVQTAAEDTAGTNTDADLLYDDFKIYYDDAADQLADLLAAADNLVLSDAKTKKALCYLIADLFLQKNPGWSASSLSVSPGESISRTDPLKTDPRKSLEKLIADAIAATTVGGLCAPGEEDEVLVHDTETYFKEVTEGTYDPEEAE